MNLTFEIRYDALPSEELWIDGDITLQLYNCGENLWRGDYNLSKELLQANYLDQIKYQYEVRNGSQIARKEESGKQHYITTMYDVERVHIRDHWSWSAGSRPLNSSLFTKAIFRREEPTECRIEPNNTILECYFTQIEPSQLLAVVGVTKELGHWDATKALVMDDAEYPLWRVSVPLVKVHTEYKYVILDRKSRDVIAWEQGENRVLEPFQFDAEQGRNLSIIKDIAPEFDLKPWRGRGVAIPIFSLRTERSMGVGDFGDIQNMVDWAVDRGMSVIQILPINDTTMGGTWEDSYPYNANSTFALHPQYLALREVATIEDEALRENFEQRAAEIDSLPQIDYTAVSALKTEYLRVAFSQEFKSLKECEDYCKFFSVNSYWLEPYALFSVLRDQHKTPDFSEWGEAAIYSTELLESYKNSDSLIKMEFYYFVQYHLHIQLLKATEYARMRGVALKGDIPIGISRTSVDAWIYPELFNMSSQAGAPPDPFSDLGQNWGFPTYNWERMAEDGFAWWRARFEKMAEYFDAYRIDHILGFFRIWEIPMGSIHGLTGRFNPALPLSCEEIEAAGFSLNEGHLRPLINDWTLGEVLGADADLEGIKSKYLDKISDNDYQFKPKYNTQRKIFAGVKDQALRDALMLLHNEVLFIEDETQKQHYHPRILGANSLVYKELNEWQQQAFNNIHHDFYYCRHNDFWRDSAMAKLPTLISSTEMLVCGEDLGMIPACVADVMQSEQILSLEIERMPKATCVEFGSPAEYPYLSVCTSSTHDMATIRGWWRENRELTQRYYNEALGQSGVAPEECSAEIAHLIIERHLNSPAMLTILPWQDWMAEDAAKRNPNVDAERINVPANSRHYWRYRMHLKL